MPRSEAPADVNKPGEPNGPTQAGLAEGPESSVERESSVGVEEVREASLPAAGGSRWIDYNTHELLEMISELEDERRWARLREGALWAILAHLALLLALFLLPRYIVVPKVVDKTAKLDKDEFTYMDTPRFRPKVEVKPRIKPPVIDRQTLEDMRKQSTQAPVQPPPPQETKPAEQPQVQTPPPPTPPVQQPQLEMPRPAAVPARPSFAMNSANPADQLREAMKNAARSHGSGETDNMNSRGLAMHPGAGSGGVQVLSDTQGVDFSNWLQRWHWETEHTWDPLIPDEVNPPINKSGQLVIRFKVLPNGRIMDGSMRLEGSSGDVALDRAAWGALTGSNYPPLPHDFHGPYLELRAWFLYNMEPGH
jgi:outer membrane biosynthesis protein TonB